LKTISVEKCCHLCDAKYKCQRSLNSHMVSMS
jgi:hypothetical protein